MMMRDSVNAVLMSGLDDWVQAAEVASVAQATGTAASQEEVCELSLRLIRYLLEQDLMEVGTVTEEDGFKSWDIPVDDAMRRIQGDWRVRPKGPGLGEVCWLNLTEKGRFQVRDL